MTPQQRLILEIVVLAAVLAIIGLGASSYLSEHDARIKLQSTLDAQGAAQKQYQQMFTDLQKQMDQRDQLYQAQLKSLDGKFQAATSPAQVAQLVSQLMGLKEPIRITTPAPTKDNPNPVPVATVPSIDFPEAKAYFQTCEECKLNLTKTTANLKDREAQAVLAQKQIDSLKLEKEAAIKAAKGTFWGNLKVRAKWLTIGIGAGAIAVCGTGHCK